jgi:hypothetical protein
LLKRHETSYHRSARQILNPHRSGATVPVQNLPRIRAAGLFDAFSLKSNPRIRVYSYRRVKLFFLELTAEVNAIDQCQAFFAAESGKAGDPCF